MNTNNLREAGEDYLEAILNLEDENGEVRSIDVAKTLNVSRPSVNKAVGVLRDMGMVDQKPYGSIKLTNLGRKRAMDVEHRHWVLNTFLVKVLGVSSETADEDACKMEHAISKETMIKLSDYLEKVTEPQKQTKITK